MDLQEKQMLRDTLNLVEKNNKILRAMHRSMQWGRVARIIYWIIIISVFIGAYYYIQPYINPLLKIMADFKNNVNSLSKLLNSVPH